MERCSEVYVGTDVAKVRNAIAVADGERGGEVRYLGEIDAAPESMRRLVKGLAAKHECLHFCYQAGPTGYGLDRLITGPGHPCTVKHFDAVGDLGRALLAFRDLYNEVWLIERHGFRPPAAIGAGQHPPAALAAYASDRCLTIPVCYRRNLALRELRPRLIQLDLLPIEEIRAAIGAPAREFAPHLLDRGLQINSDHVRAALAPTGAVELTCAAANSGSQAAISLQDNDIWAGEAGADLGAHHRWPTKCRDYP